MLMCGCEVRPLKIGGAYTCACTPKSGRARCVRACDPKNGRNSHLANLLPDLVMLIIMALISL